MRKIFLFIIFSLMVIIMFARQQIKWTRVDNNVTKNINLQRIEGFPKEEQGFEQGVSACYAGIFDGKLLIAGGCNFPDTPASRGGKKKYYQCIYAAKTEFDSLFVWDKVGELPEPAAYGVSVSCGRMV